MTSVREEATAAGMWSAIARYPAAVALALAAGSFLVFFLLPPGHEYRRDGAVARPRGRRLALVACDDAFHAFVDGQPAGESSAWSSPQAISLPDTDRVLVAVEATNYGGPGGLVGGWLSGPQALRAVPASWVCQTTKEPGWQRPEFDDHGWAPAKTVHPFGEGPWGIEPGAVLTGASWVWTQVPVGQEQTIYCRWWISRLDEAAPPANVPASPPPVESDTHDTSAGARLVVAADDVVELFVDGRRAGWTNDWAAPIRLALPVGEKRVLIAAEARNDLGPGGLIGAWRSPGGTRVPASWACGETPQPGWNLPTDDPKWPPALSLSAYGSEPWGRPAGSDLDGAWWAWTRSPAGENETIYCRWWIPAQPDRGR